MLAEHPGRSLLAPVDEAEIVLYDVLGIHVAAGADLDELLRREETRVVAISRDLRPDLRARAVAKGVHAWISMSVTSAELVSAVETIAAGEQLQTCTDRLGQHVGLTPREVEVLALVTQGYSNKEIADRLYLSINSVKSYIRSAYSKIDVRSRSRAVAWCLLNGFAPSDN